MGGVGEDEDEREQDRGKETVAETQPRVEGEEREKATRQREEGLVRRRE
jgi:hypothetical protein